MRDAHKSIWIVSSHVYKAIKDRHEDAFYHQFTEDIENACENLKVDVRAQRMYILMLYCAKKVWRSQFRANEWFNNHCNNYIYLVKYSIFVSKEYNNNC